MVSNSAAQQQRLSIVCFLHAMTPLTPCHATTLLSLQVFERVAVGEIDVPYGMAAQVSQASRAQLDEAFKKMNMSSPEEQHKFVSTGS